MPVGHVSTCRYDNDTEDYKKTAMIKLQFPHMQSKECSEENPTKDEHWENCVDKASDCNEKSIINKVVKKLYNSLLK
ncbi:hypothetical protein E2C01_016198 [Portunus trituberculatus]|uniref:Uncharacterized protein n=1 Tax=Portunus trituberculatus TaxID=210409 RepID=A0A5B7DPZ5_PORTR|nr:hypothetical protein [Portunus trituberculatus]